MIGIGEDVEKGAPFYMVGGRQAGEATLENSVEVPQEAENRTTKLLK